MTLFPLSEGQRPEVGKPLLINKLSQRPAFLCLFRGWPKNEIQQQQVYSVREQGWRSGESTRLPPMWPGFKSRRRRHMWVEIVVGSLPCSERFFSGYSGFPLSLKTNTFKFQFDLECTDTFPRVLINSLVLRG